MTSISTQSLTRRETLHARLEDGDRRITDAQRAGQDVTQWEAFWIRLLREYEVACRERDAISLASWNLE